MKMLGPGFKSQIRFFYFCAVLKVEVTNRWRKEVRKVVRKSGGFRYEWQKKNIRNWSICTRKPEKQCPIFAVTALKESGIWRFSNELCEYKMLMGALLCEYKMSMLCVQDNWQFRVFCIMWVQNTHYVCTKYSLCVYKMGHFRHFFEKIGILFSYDVF